MNLQKSKLHYYLEPLYRSGEWDQFRDYLSSPVFNRDKPLIAFLNAYESYVFLNGGVNGEELYREAFSSDTFSASHLRERMSVLLRHFYGYITFREMREDQQGSMQAFLNTLKKRGYTKHFLPLAEEAIEHHMKAPPGDEEWFLRAISLNHFIFSYQLKNSDRSPSLRFKGIDNYLDAYYAVMKLRYALVAANINRESPGHMEINAQEPLMHYLNSNLKRLPFLAKAYLYAVKCAANVDQTEDFNVLCGMLRQGLKGCEYPVVVELFTTAINFCTQKLRAGEMHFLPVSAELHERLLEEIGRMKGHPVPHWILTNYIAILLRMSQPDKATETLKKYSRLTDSPDNESAAKLAEANICLHTKKHEKAASLANEVLRDSGDFYYSIRARFCLWRADFLAGDFISFYPRYQMVRNFLATKKDIPATLRASYRNFIKLFKRAGDLYNRKNKMPREKFRGKLLAMKAIVMESDPFSEKEWLLNLLQEEANTV